MTNAELIAEARAWARKSNASLPALLRAMADALEAQEWRPIETAKEADGDFLALVPFQKTHHMMVGRVACNGNFVSWPGRSRYDPTHWKPLPAPPEGK